MDNEGGWVFISHSHLDIKLVRKIRNYLESKGFEPLLFYLKCLNDDDEIEDLIRREIDVREWFIYVDSANSRTSKWVQSEREYIKGLTGKRILTIDLSQDIIAQLDMVTRQLQVFISCASADRALAQRIAERFLAEDFLVLTADCKKQDVSFGEQTEEAVEESCRRGFVILLITKNVENSEAVLEEIRLTLEKGGKIVPVYVDDAGLNGKMLDLVGDIQGVRISSTPSEKELQELFESVLTRIEYYKSDFTMSCGFESAVTIAYPPIGRIEDFTFWDCTRLQEVTIPPAVRYISEKAFREDQDVLIKCKKGSYAERFCVAHKKRYEIID